MRSAGTETVRRPTPFRAPGLPSSSRRRTEGRPASVRSVGTLYLLWVTLGCIGIHRIYAGRPLSGVVMSGLGLAVLATVGETVVPATALAAWWVFDGATATRWART